MDIVIGRKLLPEALNALEHSEERLREFEQ